MPKSKNLDIGPFEFGCFAKPTGDTFSSEVWITDNRKRTAEILGEPLVAHGFGTEDEALAHGAKAAREWAKKQS